MRNTFSVCTVKVPSNRRTVEVCLACTALPRCHQLCPLIQTGADELQLQFNVYEQSQEQVEHILQHWDRALLLLLVPIPSEDAQMASEEAVSEKRVSACTRLYINVCPVDGSICLYDR